MGGQKRDRLTRFSPRKSLSFNPRKERIVTIVEIATYVLVTLLNLGLQLFFIGLTADSFCSGTGTGSTAATMLVCQSDAVILIPLVVDIVVLAVIFFGFRISFYESRWVPLVLYVFYIIISLCLLVPFLQIRVR